MIMYYVKIAIFGILLMYPKSNKFLYVMLKITNNILDRKESETIDLN